MKHFKPRTILAAVAEPAERAPAVIERAAQLALAFDAELVLFHAAFDAALSGRPFFDSKRLARSRGSFVQLRTRELERRRQALEQRGLRVSLQVVWEEPAHESILRAAIRARAELIVAGPHVRGRANAAFPLRQTDWQLLRLSPLPLLIVRSTQRSDGPVLAAIDPMHANDKPAALDRALIDAASALAAALEVKIHAVHSVSPVVFALGDDSAAARGTYRDKVQKKMQRSLKDAHVERSYVLDGKPETTIPELAQKLGAQLLAMGAVSRRGLARFAIGDTAERIIHASPCDLLILKPDSFELKLKRTRREQIILPAGGAARDK